MVTFYILILILILAGISINRNGYNNDYISRANCNAINGVFILIVFFRHTVQYLVKNGFNQNNVLDTLFSKIDMGIGQLLVVSFLFYSGYGIAESIKVKKNNYIDNFPRKRLLTVLLNFDIAIAFYVILSLVLGIQFTYSQALLSLVAWDSIGNSNWYILVILCCYIIIYVSYKLFGNLEKKRIIIPVSIFVLFLVTILLLSMFKGSWYYNTILCFPFGMLWSAKKEQFENIIKKKYCYISVIVGLLFAMFYIIDVLELIKFNDFSLFYNVLSILFAILIVILTMKIRIYNKWLVWLGANLFPLYIYQRLPMITFQKIFGSAWICSNAYLYVVLCLLITLVITYFYRYWKVSL